MFINLTTIKSSEKYSLRNFIEKIREKKFLKILFNCRRRIFCKMFKNKKLVQQQKLDSINHFVNK